MTIVFDEFSPFERKASAQGADVRMGGPVSQGDLQVPTWSALRHHVATGLFERELGIARTAYAGPLMLEVVGWVRDGTPVLPLLVGQSRYDLAWVWNAGHEVRLHDLGPKRLVPVLEKLSYVGPVSIEFVLPERSEKSDWFGVDLPWSGPLAVAMAALCEDPEDALRQLCDPGTRPSELPFRPGFAAALRCPLPQERLPSEAMLSDGRALWATGVSRGRLRSAFAEATVLAGPEVNRPSVGAFALEAERDLARALRRWRVS